MNGVDILTTFEVATETTFNWSLFWLVFFTVGVVSFFFFIFAVFRDNEVVDFVFSIITAVIVAVGIGFIAGDALGDPIAYENQYKVTISDEVSLNEFYEKYEVLDQDGKIYTVRERDK